MTGEREFIKIIQDCFDEYGIKKCVERNLNQPRDGGLDIHLDYLNMRIEIKRVQVLAINTWWRQTLKGAGVYTPVLAFRQNYQPWRIIVAGRGNELNQTEFITWLTGRIRGNLLNIKLDATN